MSETDIQEVLHHLSRRRFLAASAAFAATPLMPWKALALAQAPYSFTQGDFAITVIGDGDLTAADERIPSGRHAGTAGRDCQAARLDAAERGGEGQSCGIAQRQRHHPGRYRLRHKIAADRRQAGREPEGCRHRARNRHQGDPHARTPRSYLGHDRRERCAAFPQRHLLCGRRRVELLDGSRPHRQDAAGDGGFRQGRAARVRSGQGPGDDAQARRRRGDGNPGDRHGWSHAGPSVVRGRRRGGADHHRRCGHQPTRLARAPGMEVRLRRRSPTSPSRTARPSSTGRRPTRSSCSAITGPAPAWASPSATARPIDTSRRAEVSPQPFGFSPSTNSCSRKRAASSKRPSPPRSGPSTARTCTSKSA